MSVNLQSSENKYDVIGLLETFGNPDFIDENKNEKLQWWVIESGYQDVAFLIIEKYKNNVKEIKQINGRSRYIQLEIQIKVVDIINVYAPNVVILRYRFFTKFSENIPKSDELIVLSDFITSLSPPLIELGKHTVDKAYKLLTNYLTNFNCYDIWWARYPSSNVFSWLRVVRNKIVQSSIDFIFISKCARRILKMFIIDILRSAIILLAYKISISAKQNAIRAGGFFIACCWKTKIVF